MNELALFAGAGGGILGGKLLGWRTVCAVERDAYAAQVLAQRQNDGCLAPFPIWSDVCSFDGRPWQGIVGVISGGFPCQDISAAGSGTGIDGERSGLWREMARIISEVRPSFVLVENSPMLVSRGLALVISDLAKMGYDAQWGCISASDLDAPHKRDRIWILAHSNSMWKLQSSGQLKECRHGISKCSENVEHSISTRWGEGRKNNKGDERDKPSSTSKYTYKVANATRFKQERIWAIKSRQSNRSSNGGENVAYTNRQRSSRQGESFQPVHPTSNSNKKTNRPINVCISREWPTEPRVGRVVNGLAYRVDRIKALGNGQVPRVAATAQHILGRPSFNGEELLVKKGQKNRR
ncbi:DNA cytosine methyltransferase [Iodobacter sp. CM08]|uniref:DNA cytosine methyltransferase n=1 Tax=Iodobacter sp. CM08 TaxID=3085902 RepID=UPI002980E9A0|nr:DNA cytosine methyltransferase [Iodobacter sp. CM08]MDW5417467.1 DNA cytosine methyltransferase [Iodobacter sp. CM08]